MAAEVSSRDQGNRKDSVILGVGDADGGGCVTGVANIDLDLSLNLKVTTSAGWQDHLGSSTLNRGQQMKLLSFDLRVLSHAESLNPTTLLNQSSSSVCTLEKVRSALERARRCNRQQWPSDGPPSPSSSSITSSSSMIKRQFQREDDCDSSAAAAEGMMTAAGCPRCLMYVLIGKRHRRCPRCDEYVPVLVPGKKARVDLNFNLN